MPPQETTVVTDVATDHYALDYGLGDYGLGVKRLLLDHGLSVDLLLYEPPRLGEECLRLSVHGLGSGEAEHPASTTVVARLGGTSEQDEGEHDGRQ